MWKNVFLTRSLVENTTFAWAENTTFTILQFFRSALSFFSFSVEPCLALIFFINIYSERNCLPSKNRHTANGFKNMVAKISFHLWSANQKAPVTLRILSYGPESIFLTNITRAHYFEIIYSSCHDFLPFNKVTGLARFHLNFQYNSWLRYRLKS